MKVIAKRIKEREIFVKLAMNNPVGAAKLLRKHADKLEKSERVKEIVDAVMSTIFIGEKTMYNDLKK
jgi:hypothetical protein